MTFLFVVNLSGVTLIFEIDIEEVSSMIGDKRSLSLGVVALEVSLVFVFTVFVLGIICCDMILNS